MPGRGLQLTHGEYIRHRLRGVAEFSGDEWRGVYDQQRNT